MKPVRNYEEQVYAGVLGKVIGVYMGRPFEGWTKDRLEKKWGRIDRYVHEDQNVPLVVADDDISGTLTFVRALEDSGLYAETPDDFFGETWLNYLIDGKTVLWWGGMGVSTEHTAYLRLKHGVRSPESGSTALNGRVVAEQIGAQIFIDAFGMVAPGNPELAAELARRSARVSHDGEAVHGALVVAAMASAAFVEKRMDRLLDIGVSVIPADSLIARVHRDVRAWARQDRDWRKTYDRIAARYGYDKFSGGCHIIPNHAIMVLAWTYAPDDFHLSQAIINTAGWDTDCNAANVGSVMGVKVGLAGINRSYEFQAPFADRVLLPTAEGTRGVTDALVEALHIARIGRRVMGWAPLPAPKKNAWHHFALPGSCHGYMSEDAACESRGAATVTNVQGHSALGERSLRIAYQDLSAGKVARVSTPLLPQPSKSGYALTAVPRLYPGMRVEALAATGAIQGPAQARLFVRHYEPVTKKPTAMAYGPFASLKPGKKISFRLAVPETDGWPAQDFGLEIRGAARARGELFLDAVRFRGAPAVRFPAQLPFGEDNRPAGWIADAGGVWHGDGCTRLVKNEGPGVLVTGTSDWTDYSWESKVAVHLADRAGILVRYQGLRRYIALVLTRDRIQLVLNLYGERILDEAPGGWKVDEVRKLGLRVSGSTITAYLDGRKVLAGTDDALGYGGAGWLVDSGVLHVRGGTVRGAD